MKNFLFSATSSFIVLLILSGLLNLNECLASAYKKVATSSFSYSVKGKTYHVKSLNRYEATGVASWYGQSFHLKKTANGEIFNKNIVSGAHKTLPLPCIVEITNLENGKKLKVRINDRGPFVDKRIIDLSEKAAALLQFKRKGLAKVKIRYLKSETDKLKPKS